MDRDTMARKGAHADALRAFRRAEADILIGTQMVTKGLDFPNVTLVGVVSADTALNVPDFRSSERAFQLLTQVAGRAGRGRTPGEVIIQTFNPEHESIGRATRHDYAGFYEDEIAHRRELLYPPFSHMANLVASDPDDRVAETRIEAVASALRASIDALRAPVYLLGPAACPLSRLKSRYRWHLVLRTVQRGHLHDVLRHAFRSVTSRDRTSLSVDIDPLTML
jgi:primosomal protein N' (replication factor Y)